MRAWPTFNPVSWLRALKTRKTSSSTSRTDTVVRVIMFDMFDMYNNVLFWIVFLSLRFVNGV